MISITSTSGRIGAFWWLNAITSLSEHRNPDGQIIRSWRPGACGWRPDSGLVTVHWERLP